MDFYCSKLNFAIEIDGMSHHVDGDSDVPRDAWLKSKRIAVLRFPSPKNRKEAAEIAAVVERHCLAVGWVPTNESENL